MVKEARIRLRELKRSWVMSMDPPVSTTADLLVTSGIHLVGGGDECLKSHLLKKKEEVQGQRGGKYFQGDPAKNCDKPRVRISGKKSGRGA